MAGAYGGKARTCWALAQGAKGLVTAGSRASPQVDIVARIARKLAVPCRVHVPSGAWTPELVSAAEQGAEVVQHRPGYNSVIVARARKDAVARGWTEIPFGMECEMAVRQTRAQVANLPSEFLKSGFNETLGMWGPTRGRIVTAVGSGMSLAGILWGLTDRANAPDDPDGFEGRAWFDVPVLGVVVGADPRKRLDKYAPPEWRLMTTLVSSRWAYHSLAIDDKWPYFPLDPIYEAKAIEYLRPGDLLWVVGIRPAAREAKA